MIQGAIGWLTKFTSAEV